MPNQPAQAGVVGHNGASVWMGIVSAALATLESDVKNHLPARTTVMTKAAVWTGVAPASQGTLALHVPIRPVPKTARVTANVCQDDACVTLATLEPTVGPATARATATDVESAMMGAVCASQVSRAQPVAPNLALMTVTREGAA